MSSAFIAFYRRVSLRIRCALWSQLLPLLACIAATSAWAEPMPSDAQAGVTLTFDCATGPDGVLRVDTIPVLTPRNAQSANDTFLAERLRQAFAAEPANWRTLPAFRVPDSFKAWLHDTLISAGLSAPIIVTVRTGVNSRWNVAATVTAPPYSGMRIDVPTTALPANTPAVVVPSSELAVSASPLWLNTSIRLVGTRTTAPAATGTEAVVVIRDIAAQTATAGSAAYSHSQDELTYTKAIEASVVDTVATHLGPPYVAAVSFAPDTAVNGSRVLVVTINGLDPVVTVRSAVTQIEMPDNLGGRMSLAAFTTRFGATRLGRQVLADQRRCEAEVQRALATRVPSATLPRFIGDDERAVVARHLATLTGVALVTHRETGGELVFDVLYSPPQGAMTASLNADATREFTGSASFNYHWQNGPQLSAEATLGLTTTALSASAGTSRLALGARWNAQADIEGAYQRDRDVRLGTLIGPLVTVRSADAGGRLTLDYDSGVLPSGAQHSQRVHAESSLYARERWLEGDGPSAFLGQPRSLTGPALTLRQEFSFDDQPAADHTPPPALGKRTLFASVEITHWLPDDHPDYSSGRAGISLRQEFGGVTPSDSYLELRGAAGLTDQAAPRIDFFRLGADNGLCGLDDGELAGRFFATGAIEAGHSLGAWLRRASASASTTQTPGGPPSPLDGFYVFALAEYGRVGRQDDAGGSFNPDTSASSYALGGRFFGAVPGVGSAASISFGYAWSPESIRENGRFFTRIVIPFGN